MNERSRTKYIVLGILAIAPSSGYEINKTIKESTNYFWAESEGQIYPALGKCVAEGFAKCKEEQSKERIKKVYTITLKGKRVLNEWLKKPAQKALIRSEFLLKIFFAGNIENKEVILHLTNFRDATKEELLQLEKMRLELDLAENYSPQHSKFWRLSVDYGIKSMQADISWCEDAIASLK